MVSRAILNGWPLVAPSKKDYGRNLASMPQGGTFLAIGDSTDAGVQTGVGTAQVSNSWPTQYASLLASTGIMATAQNRYGCGSGQWAAPSGLLGIDGRVSSIGTWTQTGTLVPGGNGFGSSTAGDSATFLMGLCNKIVIEWQDNAAGRAFSYQVDGGAPVEIPTTGNYLVRRTTISVPLGVHSITINQKTAGCNLRGVEAYDDTNGMPIRVINCGISGATSTQLANDSGTADSRLQGYANFQPHLTVIQGGLINNAVNGVSAAQTRTDLLAIANKVLASRSGAQVLFRTPNPIGDSAPIRAALDALVQVQKNVAAELNCGIIDINGLIGNYENGVRLGFMSDTRHLTTLGNAFVAHRVRRAVSIN